LLQVRRPASARRRARRCTPQPSPIRALPRASPIGFFGGSLTVARRSRSTRLRWRIGRIPPRGDKSVG